MACRARRLATETGCASDSAHATSRAPAGVFACSSISDAIAAGSVASPIGAHRHRVLRDDDVEHRRTLLRALHQLAQLRLGRITLDLERDADPLEAVAHVVRQAERAAHVHVAFEAGLHSRQAHATRRGHVHQRRRQAGRERVEQRLGRIGAGVGAQQNRRLARVDGEFASCATCPPGRRRRSP